MARSRWIVGRALGAGLLGWSAYTMVCWARYGHVSVRRHDDRLDALIADPEIDEQHETRIRAPASAVMRTLRELDVNRSPTVWLMFNLRTLPTRLRGGPVQWEYTGLGDQMLAIGWGVLADVPGRLLVAGAVTKPWEADVRFHPLLPDEFAAFHEPGYVKIVWTLEADDLPSAHGSVARTRIRVKTTDPVARRRFRCYWAILSPGIILVHYEIVRLARRELTRRNIQSHQE